MLLSVFDFIIPVRNFWGTSQKNFYRPKPCKIWPDFGRLQSSAANISGMDEDIQNRWVTRSTAIPPALAETSTVKLWNCTQPKRIFRKTIFRPLGVLRPKFLHALENDQVLLALCPKFLGCLCFATNFFPTRDLQGFKADRREILHELWHLTCL